MPTLTANDVQRSALEVRRAAARVFALRARVETYPDCGQLGRIVKVENHIRAKEHVPAHAEMDLIEAAVWAHVEKLEAAEVEAATARQSKLMEARGIASASVGKAHTRDGWQWLITKGRLSDQQKWAGERYANYYALAMRDGMSSSANDNPGGSAGGDDNPFEARLKAKDALDHVARHIVAATGSDRLAQLLASVCGKGESLRAMVANDDRRASILETDLRTALDMASAAFKGGPLADIERLRATIAGRDAAA